MSVVQYSTMITTNWGRMATRHFKSSLLNKQQHYDIAAMLSLPNCAANLYYLYHPVRRYAKKKQYFNGVVLS